MRSSKILLICFAFLFPFTVIAAEPVYLLAMRVQPATTMTRFTFILTKKTDYQTTFLSNPDRILVELKNTTKNFIVRNAKLGNANVYMMSEEKNKNHNIHFLFYVKEKVEYKINFIPSKNKYFNLQLTITSVSAKKTTAKLQSAFRQDMLDTFSKLVKNTKPVATKAEQFIVVIDAGHGGKDPGALGVRGVKEKHVVLAIAKYLASEINKTPGMRAVLTRHGDYFVPLRQRLKLARKGNADLFIAIHADAFFNNYKTGASVFALSPRGATTEAARWLAQRQNYSELDNVELDSLKDRSPFLRYMLIDLAQTATIRDSLRLGNKVLDALDNVSSLHYKHVEQAPFVVLKSPDIPSILIETGFITNPHEERRLANPKYQQQLACAIKQGIVQFKLMLDQTL